MSVFFPMTSRYYLTGVNAFVGITFRAYLFKTKDVVS